MNISYQDSCGREEHKHTHTHTHTHTQTERSRRHSTSCLIRNQYFICSPPLLRCWLASRPKRTAQGHTHTLLYTLMYPAHTLNSSQPLLVLTDMSALLCWHLVDTLPLSDARCCLPTALRNTPHFNVYMSFYACVLNASGLPSLHTLLVSLLDHCLYI